MIYIKTDMKEMPKGCIECPKFRGKEIGQNNKLGCFCAETELRIDIAGRPDWCPLVEVKI